MGLLAYAYPAARGDLERATDLFRLFREQPTPELARTARAGLQVGDLAERAAAAALSPVDELRDRAALRARERGHRDQRWVSLPRVRLADHPRDPHRLRRGETGWDRRHRLARDEAERRTVAAAGGVGCGRGRGRHRGYRLHHLALDRGPAFHGVQLEEAKLGVLSAALFASVATWLVFRAAAMLPRQLRIRALARHGRADHRPRRARRLRARPHPRTGGIAGDRARIRRLRVSLLWARRAGCTRAARRVRRRALRLAASSAHRRPPAVHKPPPKQRRPPPRRAPSGRCTTCCSTTRTRCVCRIWSAMPKASASTSRNSRTTCDGRRRESHRGGRGLCRSERRLRHADVLHQRQAALRGV